VQGAGTRDNGRHLGVALFAIATAQLMVVLDAIIVNVALADRGSGPERVRDRCALFVLYP